MKARSVIMLLSLLLVSISVPASSISDKPPLTKAITVHDKININTAGLMMLTGSFKGIGKKRAQAIIAYRESHHGFKSLEELAEIKGFGQHFVDVHRDKLNEVFVVH